MTDVVARLKSALADRYTIERELGRGGMAVVYLAEDVKHHRTVAVKVLRPELAAAVGAERFLNEIRVTANLQHPHILPLHDSGDADGFLYYVMPYIDGESLREKLNREKQLSVDEALKITSQIADALHSAHEQGVVHRDIKPENILRDSKGSFYVVLPESYNEPPLVFDARGRFVQAIGRSGDGPGEFRNPVAVVVSPADSVYVFDGQTGRLTVLSPALKVVRTAPFANRMWTATRLTDGSFIVNANLPNPDRFGYPLHRYDATGNYLQTLSDDNPLVVPRYPRHFLRWIFPSSDGGVWSTPLNHQYKVEKWDKEGRPQVSLHRDADWFMPYDRYDLPTPDRPPMPQMLGVWEDGDGLAWTLAHVGDPDWRRGIAEGVRAEGQMMYRILDHQRVFDCIIEVIDPSSGTLVTSQRFNGAYDVVIEPNLIAAIREAESGWHYVEIFEVQLDRP